MPRHIVFNGLKMKLNALNLTRISQPELAAMLGVEPRTVGRWRQDEGLPIAEQTTGPVQAGTPQFLFDWSQVFPWFLARENKKAVEKAMGTRSTGAVDLGTSEHRKLAAEAEIAELKLAKARGEVMPIEIYGDRLSSAFAVARTRILAVRDKVEGEIGTESAKIVDREIRGALQSLADDGAKELAS